MKVGISLHFIKKGSVGGAEHMAYNIVRGLLAIGQDVVIACVQIEALDDDFVAETRSQDACTFIEIGAAKSRFVREILGAKRLARVSDAVIYPNYFTPPTALFTKTPTVTIVHDLQYLNYSEFFSLKKRLWLFVAHIWTVLFASRTVTISEFVRNDMIKFYGKWCEKKISVIYNPISWDRFKDSGSFHLDIESPFLLSVAADYPHKNLITLVKAFSDLSADYPELKLILVGQLSENLSGDIKKGISLSKYIKCQNLSDRIVIAGYVDNLRLGALYLSSKAFLFPSLFEGFGMPPVEALGLNKSVIVSNCAALPETTLGYATHYISDPTNVEEWTAAIHSILKDEIGSPTIEEVSHLRKIYSLDNIAKQYIEILQTDWSEGTN